MYYKLYVQIRIVNLIAYPSVKKKDQSVQAPVTHRPNTTRQTIKNYSEFPDMLSFNLLLISYNT